VFQAATTIAQKRCKLSMQTPLSRLLPQQPILPGAPGYSTQAGAFRHGDTSVAAAACAEEIRRLCQRAAMCENLDAALPLISDAKHRLTDLQKLLGLH
jgi:hypothetical protein